MRVKVIFSFAQQLSIFVQVSNVLKGLLEFIEDAFFCSLQNKGCFLKFKRKKKLMITGDT